MSGCDKSLIRYPVPEASACRPHCSELLVRKSRFLAQVCNCASVEEAREFIADMRGIHADATHNCWAFVAGPPGDTAAVGSSDDGEPRGTAGRPMLQVLLHSGVGQICAVVTRWFGGIKLGTGGLARAYQDAVLENLKTLPLVECVNRTSWKLIVDYGCLDSLRGRLADLEANIEARDYNTRVELIVSVPDDMSANLCACVAAISNGNADIKRLDEFASNI